MRTEKGKYLPTLNLKGYLGANQYTNNFDPIAANTWFGLSYVGIDIKYPLLFGEDKRKKIQQLQFQSTQYYQQKDDKVAQYSKDAVVAKIKIEGILSELKTQQENIALSAESIAIFQSRVAEGEESAYILNLEEADLQKLTADYQSNKKGTGYIFLLPEGNRQNGDIMDSVKRIQPLGGEVICPVSRQKLMQRIMATLR